MKISNILEYKNNCNRETPDLESFHSIERLFATLSDPERYILSAVELCIVQLNWSPQKSFGADEFDLLLRQLRLNSLKCWKAAYKKMGEEGKDTKLIPPKYRSEQIEDALHIFLHSVGDFSLVKARDTLGCKSENLSHISNMVKAWTGEQADSVIAVLSQFIWLIKRKLFNLSAENHIMPILFGRQSGGKSRAIKALLAPLTQLDFTLFVGISQMTDERFLKVLSENYVVFADEMTAAEKTDINALKNIITAEILTPRKLATNSAFKIKQNCTFIGATNRHVNELIFDSTGMRRFYQINCLDKMDWVGINGINYLELIKGIDEQKCDGYLVGEILEQVKQEQENLVNRDDLNMFLDELGIVAGPDGGSFLSYDDLYSKYSDWTYENGLKYKISKGDLTKRMRNRGFINGSKKLDRATRRGFWVLDSITPLKEKSTIHNLNGGKNEI